MRRLVNVLALGVITCALSATALAQDRVALVIGIDRYPNLPAEQQLSKAVSDARSVADTLEKIGFKVRRGENVDRAQMVDHVHRFAQTIKPGDTAVVFFAGHGVALSGGNYLMPADIPDMRPGDEGKARNMALSEADILADLQVSNPRVMVMILDACRDNPFKQPGLTRSLGGQRGLARGREAEGVFTIYSAGFGQAALDGLGKDDKSPNSVFTRALIPALSRSDAHLADVIIDMREEVSRLAATIGHQQYPAYYDQTRGGRIYLSARAAAAYASRKVALLVGINKYPKIGTLKNPVADASAVGNMLRRAGFDSVRIEPELDRETLMKALRDFKQLAEGADTAVIYFAGQGGRAAHARYVLAADASEDALANHVIGLTSLQEAIPRSARVRLVIVDACQANIAGFDPKDDPSPPSTDHAMVLYSSGPHQQALDGEGELSPFAEAFLKHFQTPGRSIREAANLVRDEVTSTTKGGQTPVFYGSATTEVTLLGK